MDGGSSAGNLSTGGSGEEDADDPISSGVTFVSPDSGHAEDGWCSAWVECNDSKCVPSSFVDGVWQSTVCVPVLGQQSVGEACDPGQLSTDNCDMDSWCLPTDAGGDEVCVAFCWEGPSCPSDKSCIQIDELGLGLCLSSCDPLQQDCADQDYACAWSGSAFECTATFGEVDPLQPCADSQDCDPSALCLEASALSSCAGESCCASLCSLSAGDAPCQVIDPAYECVAFYEEGSETPPEYADIGVCMLPA
ncbi:hypothetical protein G6O69_19990 [Pseudenhygromyxa sp. WMMC2535]|uniref:hypothetical protein n=1 Tax=Pseudenhygromyxa sp. WMMC2535 TaxID=2712867 RepID=UPI00155523DC|nr:hypothetical protein [Pseudenhygromyxa sp. WMMC2535]NVB40138.1 hypothetical protein [Pseudenhygromyxa sp. WMMC2535]